MKREELKAYNVYSTRDDGAYGFCKEADPTDVELEKVDVYIAPEANKVMDSMEARIKEMEEDYRKISEMYIAEQTKAAKYEQRIKELEKALENAVAGGEIIKGLCERHEARIKELESIPHTDNSAVIATLQNRIKELEAEVKKWKQDNRYLSAFVRLLYKGKDANSTAVIAVANRMDELEAENARLKVQVPKWHDLTKPLYTEDGVDYYDLPTEHGDYIVDCGGCECTHSEYDPEYNDWCDLVSTAKVTRWCEFPQPPTTEELEKENGL